MPAAWRTPLATDTTDAAWTGRWWTAFGDPALDRAVDTALAHNDELHIAAARVLEAEAQFRSARAQRGPDVVAGGTRVRERSVNAGFGTPEEQTAGESLLSVSFDADLFGRLARGQDAAGASLMATRADRASVELAVAGATVRGYLTLRMLDQRLAILQRTLIARQTSLALMQRRVSVGYASQLELSQSDVELRSAEQMIPPTLLAIRRTENALNVLLGQPPEPIERADGELPAVPLVPEVLPSSLLRRRPDIVAAEDRLVAADRTLDASRAAFMPDFKISADYGSVTSSLIRNSPLAIFSLGGSVLAPIFDSGRLQAQQTMATARRDEAAFAYRRATLQALADVEDALAATQRTSEQSASLDGQRDALQHSLQIATARYRAGYAAYLDQLDAQRSLLGVELSRAQVQADRLTACVALFEAVGGGWDRSMITAPSAPLDKPTASASPR